MSIHFIMQGKGGVGKSMIASILIQYFLKQGFTASGFDTDTVNLSLAKYKSLNIKTIDIMDGDEIDPGRFDQLIHHIAESPPEHQMVVDIGASCFLPLCAYLKEYRAFELIQKLGFRTYLHTILAGCANLKDTLNSFNTLVQDFKMPTVVWLNPFFGEIRIGNNTFVDSEIYCNVANSIHGVIEMPELDPNFLGSFSGMQTHHFGFDEAVRSHLTWLIDKQRLVMIWRDYQKAIGEVPLV